MAQQLGKIIAAGGSSRLGRKIDQDLPGVIGAAKESAINPPRDLALHLRPYQDEDDAQARAHGNADAFMSGKVQSQRVREHQRNGNTEEEYQQYKSALHQKITRAALDQYRDLQHAVLCYGIGKR